MYEPADIAEQRLYRESLAGCKNILTGAVLTATKMSASLGTALMSEWFSALFCPLSFASLLLGVSDNGTWPKWHCVSPGYNVTEASDSECLVAHSTTFEKYPSITKCRLLPRILKQRCHEISFVQEYKSGFHFLFYLLFDLDVSGP